MSKSARVFFWLTGWVAALVLAVLLIVGVAVWWSKGELARYRAELEARGERFSMEELAPAKANPVGNGGDEALQVGASMGATRKVPALAEVRISLKEVSPGMNEVLHKRDLVLGSTPPRDWAEVEEALAPFQPQLARLRELAKSPELTTDLDYGLGVRMTLDMSGPLQYATLLLAVDTQLRLRAGDATGAVEDVVTLLRLTSIQGRHPGVISQVMYGAFLSFAQAGTWEVLQSDAASAGDLKMLQDAWATIAPTEMIIPMLRMERAQGLVFFASRESISSAYGHTSWPPGNWDDVLRGSRLYLWSTVYRHSDQRQFIAESQDLIDKVSKQGMAGWSPVLSSSKGLTKASHGEESAKRLASALMQPDWTSLLATIVHSETMSQLTVTALAIRRYQLKHEGAVPPSLEALVPGYLDKLPVDPWDGKTLRYRVEGDGYLLYSVGMNGVDDGGDASQESGPKARSRDVVWPRTAEATEGGTTP